MSADLVATNKELEAFSYSVSHVFARAAQSHGRLLPCLMEDYADKLDSHGKGYLERVRAASKRMDQLVDGLLGLSRMARARCAGPSWT